MDAGTPVSTGNTGSEQIRILLTGSSGQVGGDLLTLLRRLGSVIAPVRADLDLSNIEQLRQYVRDVKPHWIINPAAYTAVDKAESEPEAARVLNTVVPCVLGEEALGVGTPVIHFSTDYVFDGSGSTPWKETDPPGPLNVYGATKLGGEQGLKSTGAAHLIFRTSWVYSSLGKNFLKTMLRLSEERSELKIVADQHGAPTWSKDLAHMVFSIVSGMEKTAVVNSVSRADAVRTRGGIYHAAAAGETTWFGFAEEIQRLAQAAWPDRKQAILLPVSTEAYPTPARRPRNSRLNCDRLRQVFGYELPDWRVSVERAMQELASS